MNAQELWKYLNKLRLEGVDLEAIKVTVRAANEVKQTISLYEVDDVDNNSVGLCLSINI